MRSCGFSGCSEWSAFGQCYWHSKARWLAGSYSPQSLAEALWLWGAREPVAKWNGSTWLDANDVVARAESRFDTEVKRGIRYLVTLGETRRELEV